MQPEELILDRIRQAREAFGSSCKKFAGSVTAQEIRATLMADGILVSERDVFVKGVPFEIDLLILRPTARAAESVVHEPRDVLAAIEVKNNGVFSKDSAEKIRRSFSAISAANKQIKCIYLCLSERKGYRYAITREAIGYPAFTLFEYTGSGRTTRFDRTGQWDSFVAHLKTVLKSK